MRGSVIQRRWIISVALVGLFSLLLATQTARWSDGSASAQTTTAPTLPTATPTPIPSDLRLTGCANLPSSLSLNPGVTVSLAVDLLGEGGAVNNDLPGIITYLWSGPGSFSSPTTRATLYTSPSSSGTINLEVHQSGTTFFCTVNIAVNVIVPPVPPPATATPFNPPGPVPTLTTTAANTNIGGVTPAEGGSVKSTTRPGVEVTVPRGAVTEFSGVQVTIVEPNTAPAPGANLFRIGSTVVDIKITNSAGTPLPGTRLTVPAEICLPYTPADAAGSYGGPASLQIWRYDESLKNWIPLTSTVDPVAQVVCAMNSQFSLFALGLVPAPASTPTVAAQATATPVGPTATPATGLPVTGDFSAGPGLLAVAALAGAAFIGLGVIALRRSRRSTV